VEFAISHREEDRLAVGAPLRDVVWNPRRNHAGVFDIASIVQETGGIFTVLPWDIHDKDLSRKKTLLPALDG
jgi:hypothetical protein